MWLAVRVANCLPQPVDPRGSDGILWTPNTGAMTMAFAVLMPGDNRSTIMAPGEGLATVRRSEPVDCTLQWQ